MEYRCFKCLEREDCGDVSWTVLTNGMTLHAPDVELCPRYGLDVNFLMNEMASTVLEMDTEEYDGVNVRSKVTDDEPIVYNIDIETRTNLNKLDGAIRAEEVGSKASEIAAIPAVRQALLERQRAFATFPGLLADGRDMGTVVFPHAQLKIFLTASPEERAKRRYKQLKKKGIDANLPELVGELKARDKRDSERTAAPLKAADDAVLLDTTEMSIDEVVNQVLQMANQCFGDNVV